jgi:anthranilate synthase/aminodeoxychorismate synthase-like glutamine amidotransferase
MWPGASPVSAAGENASAAALRPGWFACYNRDRMIVLIDNYDSFTYNLVQKLGEIDPARPMRVFRNDKVTVEQVEQLKPTHIVISPGPCTPREGGVSNDIIGHFAPRLPVLGVCLGHQCIGHVYGAEVVRADRLMHGKTDLIHHDEKSIYEGMPNPFTATRYHSLIIRPGTLPAEFIVTSWTDYKGTMGEEIMGVRHRTWPLEGVQFHPESFLTEQGERLLANFLRK